MRILAVNNDVYIRPKMPNRSVFPKGVIYEGSEVEVVRKVTGESIEGNHIWYENEIADYMWSGGFVEVESGEIDWGVRSLGINKLWKFTRGKGITVAILDTGLFKAHPDIDSSKITGEKNFVDGSADINDLVGHGTHCTGIIAASGKLVNGIAPEVKLVIGKITDNENEIQEDILWKGIEWAIKDKGVDIVSMSLYRSKISEAFKKNITSILKNTDVLLVGAIGNKGSSKFKPTIYPAMLPECLSIGSANRDLAFDMITTKSAKIDFFAPGSDINSLWNDGCTRHVGGTSMATAFFSGAFALLKSFIKNHASTEIQQITNEKLIDILKSYPKKAVEYHIGNRTFVKPLLDPVKVLEKLGEPFNEN
jgi:major intracellular serine protease